MKLEPVCLGTPCTEMLPGEFLLSTWNVWFDRHLRAERNMALLAELKQYRPHVMIFQEVTLPFVRAIQETEWLKDGYWVSGVEHNQIGVVMVARVQCQEVAFHPLTSAMGRRLLTTSFSNQMVLAGGHFESNRGSGEVRATQFGEALEKLGGATSAVLAGDFNCSAEEPESGVLTRARDAWSTLREEPGYTVDSTRNEMLRRQAPNKDVQARIDRLLCLGNVKPLEIRMLGTEPFTGSEYPSDHFGLLARLTHS